ncbi:MAG: type III pantothenate kinase [Nitrospirae bacterium]|nr:MAG: type III pantothenate kinase [Nitrospirota bacterium]
MGLFFVMLLIDIGNTRLKGAVISKNRRQQFTFPISDVHNRSKLIPIFSELLKKHNTTDALISSVVPTLNETVKEIISPLIKGRIYILGPDTDTGVRLATQNPTTIGADRIANAVFAWHETRRASVVVDLGSATTVTVVNGFGELIGGAILPGITMMAEALSEKTGKLPLVKLRQPSRATGENTENSIISGIIFGTAGAIEKIVSITKEELGEEPALFLTGGNATYIKEYLEDSFIYREDLTMKGLEIILRRLRGE